jgi:hypothetical protein
LSELANKVLAIIDSNLDRAMKAELVIDAVARGLGRLGADRRKPVPNRLRNLKWSRIPSFKTGY